MWTLTLTHQWLFFVFATVQPNVMTVSASPQGLRSILRLIHTRPKREGKEKIFFDICHFSLIFSQAPWSFPLFLPFSYGVNGARSNFFHNRGYWTDRSTRISLPKDFNCRQNQCFIVVVPSYIGDNEFTIGVLTSESRLEPLESLFRNVILHFMSVSVSCI